MRYSSQEFCGQGEDSLDGTEYTSDGKSPHCPLFQVNEGIWGIWKYDCTGLQRNQIVKGVLQALNEKHKRDCDDEHVVIWFCTYALWTYEEYTCTSITARAL